MARITIRNRWLAVAGQAVIWAVILTGVCVLFGASFAYAVAYGMTYAALAAFSKCRRERRRDEQKAASSTIQ